MEAALLIRGRAQSSIRLQVELFPEQEVTAIAAADALWRHTCRFTDRNGFWFAIYEPITNAF
jgi:hypothetical protein